MKPYKQVLDSILAEITAMPIGLRRAMRSPIYFSIVKNKTRWYADSNTLV